MPEHRPVLERDLDFGSAAKGLYRFPVGCLRHCTRREEEWCKEERNDFCVCHNGILLIMSKRDRPACDSFSSVSHRLHSGWRTLQCHHAGSGLWFGVSPESVRFAGDAACTVNGRWRTISTLVPTGREISSPRVNNTLAKPSPTPIRAPGPTPMPTWRIDPTRMPAPVVLATV